MPGMRHIHSAKFRRCVRKVKAKQASCIGCPHYNPYAVCEASIGYKGSVLKGSRRRLKRTMK